MGLFAVEPDFRFAQQHLVTSAFHPQTAADGGPVAPKSGGAANDPNTDVALRAELDHGCQLELRPNSSKATLICLRAGGHFSHL